ncbi:mitotic interactor and substrate of PLK1 [Paroedura picta]|uniref:mitotic interactor and substrate of PLK1 n=1 Tax=Paroedura picta TaxID=143630 RepID=UPI00405708C5
MGQTEAEQTQQAAPAMDRTQEKVPLDSTPEMDPESSSGTRDVPQNTGPKYEGQNGDRTVSPGEWETEYFSFVHGHQKTGNRRETITFLEDEIKSTTDAVNGRRDLWTPSTDRESKLEVVKTGPRYDVRAYKGEKKPSRLYEDEGELRYELPPKNLSPEKAKELEEERQEVIRSQAMKKSTTTAEKGTSVDKPGAPSPAMPSGEQAETCRRDTMSFAVCFDKPSPGWERTVIDPENIDTEQINFAAARHQFLALEKRNPNLLLGPRKLVTPPRLPASQNVCERECLGRPAVLKDARDPDGPNQRESDLTHEKAALVIPQKPDSEGRAAIYQDFPGENLHSEETGGHLRTKVHNGRLPEKEPGDALDLVACGQDPTEELEVHEETPIEREIRLSVEREETLWRERGVLRPSSRDELVKVRSKSLLSSPLSAPASSRKRKDRAGVSFFVQREIEQEIKREEDLQKEGRLPGVYDKGTPKELGERRRIFEQDGTQLSSAHRLQHPGVEQEFPPVCLSRHSIANDRERTVCRDMNQSSAPTRSHSALRPGLGDEPGQSRLQESPGPKLRSMKEAADPDAQLVLRKERFGVPMQRSQPTFPDARRTEGRPRWAAPREELYTLKTAKARISLLIEQEIQDALQREEELQEQRRGGRLAGSGGTEQGKEKGFHSPPPAQSSERTPSEPDSKTPGSQKQSPVEEEKRRRQREEGKYAGIEPMDEIDTEVVNSTKVVRHQGLRAQLWEAGQILKRGEDSDPELPLFDF